VQVYVKGNELAERTVRIAKLMHVTGDGLTWLWHSKYLSVF